jgi:hypothetical protein
LKNKLPEFFMPRTKKRGIRRIRRSSMELKDLFKKYNFEIIEEQNPNSENNFFVLKK